MNSSRDLESMPIEVQLLVSVEHQINHLAPPVRGASPDQARGRERMLEIFAAYVHEKYGYKPERSV